MDKKYFDSGTIKGQKQKVVADAVKNALTSFCEQEQEFEQAIEQSGKTFQECLDHVVEGCGSCLSDIDAYTKAVKFYFSTAAVHFVIKIDLSADNGAPDLTITHNDSTEKAESKSQLSVSLDDLLGDL